MRNQTQTVWQGARAHPGQRKPGAFSPQPPRLPVSEPAGDRRIPGGAADPGRRTAVGDAGPATGEPAARGPGWLVTLAALLQGQLDEPQNVTRKVAIIAALSIFFLLPVLGAAVMIAGSLVQHAPTTFAWLVGALIALRATRPIADAFRRSHQPE